MTDRFTYFIQAEIGGPIKIGVADSPVARLQALQTGNPNSLAVVGVLEGDHWESRLHDRFASVRVQGEWFMESPDLVDLIGALHREVPQPAFVQQPVEAAA